MGTRWRIPVLFKSYGLIVTKKKTALLLLCCAITFFFCSPAYADTKAPATPYTILLDDGNKIFHMTPLGQENEEQLKSGLYYNSDPLMNIYYIPEDERFNIDYSWGYFHNGNIFFSRDGLHFAYVGVAHTKGWGDLKGTAIGFYQNGNLVKSYRVKDLIKDRSKVTFSVSSAWWEEWQKREYNEQENTLTVATKDGRIITFDITTGDIVPTKDDDMTVPPAIILIGSIALLALVMAAA
ncbi:MAG: hypothetical protein AAGU12_05895 [Clostridiales bacterium]